MQRGVIASSRMRLWLTVGGCVRRLVFELHPLNHAQGPHQAQHAARRRVRAFVNHRYYVFVEWVARSTQRTGDEDVLRLRRHGSGVGGAVETEEIFLLRAVAFVEEYCSVEVNWTVSLEDAHSSTLVTGVWSITPVLNPMKFQVTAEMHGRWLSVA